MAAMSAPQRNTTTAVVHGGHDADGEGGALGRPKTGVMIRKLKKLPREFIE